MGRWRGAGDEGCMVEKKRGEVTVFRGSQTSLGKTM